MLCDRKGVQSCEQIGVDISSMLFTYGELLKDLLLSRFALIQYNFRQSNYPAPNTIGRAQPAYFNTTSNAGFLHEDLVPFFYDNAFSIDVDVCSSDKTLYPKRNTDFTYSLIRIIIVWCYSVTLDLPETSFQTAYHPLAASTRGFYENILLFPSQRIF